MNDPPKARNLSSGQDARAPRKSQNLLDCKDGGPSRRLVQPGVQTLHNRTVARAGGGRSHGRTTRADILRSARHGAAKSNSEPCGMLLVRHREGSR